MGIIKQKQKQMYKLISIGSLIFASHAIQLTTYVEEDKTTDAEALKCIGDFASMKLAAGTTKEDIGKWVLKACADYGINSRAKLEGLMGKVAGAHGVTKAAGAAMLEAAAAHYGITAADIADTEAACYAAGSAGELLEESESDSEDREKITDAEALANIAAFATKQLKANKWQIRNWVLDARWDFEIVDMAKMDGLLGKAAAHHKISKEEGYKMLDDARKHYGISDKELKRTMNKCFRKGKEAEAL